MDTQDNIRQTAKARRETAKLDGLVRQLRLVSDPPRVRYENKFYIVDNQMRVTGLWHDQ